MNHQTENAVRVFDKHARMYADKFMDVSAYATGLDLLCTKLDRDCAEVLETGCGPGNVVQYLKQRRPDLRITGIDLAPGMIEVAKENNPTSEFIIMDARKINELNRKFDAIIASFCIPYLSKDEAIGFIGVISDMLNEKGLIYLSTMEDNNDRSGYREGSSGDELFINYHEESYLKAALEKHGNLIIHTARIDSLEEDSITTVDLVLVAQKKSS